jgi:hypothetical protein
MCGGAQTMSVRPLMVRRIIEQDIVGDSCPTEFAVFNHRFNAFCTEFLLKEPPVVAFVGGKYSHFVEISFE